MKTTRNQMTILGVLSLVVMGGLTPLAKGELRTVHFQGIVDEITGHAVSLAGVTAGDEFMGSYTFDTTTPPARYPWEHSAYYEFRSPHQRFTVTIGSYTWQSQDLWHCVVCDNSTHSGGGDLHDGFDDLSPSVRLEQATGPALPGYGTVDWTLASETNLSVITSTQVPSTLPDPSLCEFNNLTMYLYGATGSSATRIKGHFVGASGGSATLLLVDGGFEASADSADLQTNAAEQDWYESRKDMPTLVTLDTAVVGIDDSHKAKFTSDKVSNAYLSQEFSAPQSGRFQAQWDIYMAAIYDGSVNPDRAGWMLIGDDSGTDRTRIGPNAEDSERFVYMAFYKSGGGATGTMDLVARDRDDTWITFTTVAAGLNLKQWYTIKVDVDVAQGTYDVYVDGQFKATVTSRMPKSRVTHISFAQWDDGPGTFYVDNVSAESSSSEVVSSCGLEAGDRVILMVDNPVGLPQLGDPLSLPADRLYAGTLGTVVCPGDAWHPDRMYISWDGWTHGAVHSGSYCETVRFEPYSGWWMSCQDVAPLNGGGSSSNVDLYDLGESYRGFEPQVFYCLSMNQPITIYLTVANGGTEVSPPTPIRFYASKDTNITTSDYQIDHEGTLPSIEPGTAISCRAARIFPDNIPPGTYYMGWIIDPDNTISETNKNNNTAYKMGYQLSRR